ncbi:hypothetical protein [Pseudomonas fluorescens]|uniref:hypothetical protein n=1 Tax=Pseudomonas fluorescens TaxID=294 RepID=UPI00124024CC|nr:hypothetical protein [Pseudomonas fluorescens]
METAIFAFIGALIGSLLTFISSLASTFGKSKDTQLDVRTKVVTNERAQWRKDMRDLSASFVAICNRMTTNLKKEDDQFDLDRTRVLIRLRLNANPEHELDARLLKNLKLLSKIVHDKNYKDLSNDLDAFETDMQELLKREWDKSKGEAETGNIAPPDQRSRP